MNKIIIVSSKIDEELNDILQSSEIEFQKLSSTGFGPADFIQYLTVGGGLVALVNIIIQLRETKKGTRSIKIVKESGEMLEVSGMSKEDIIYLLEIGQKILIKDKDKSKK